MADRTDNADCCIAGGGPAGMVLGLLLARAGLDVTVLEKHADFLRDFRGDTIHPSTMELMAELGLADKVLGLRHTKVSSFALEGQGIRVVVGDLRRLRTPFPYIVFVPQWDFLDLLAAEARSSPGFRLLMNAEARELVTDDGVVRGVRYMGPDGEHEVRAPLTIAADGRDSRLRDAAGLEPVETSAPMDVLWFRLPRRPDEPEGVALRPGAGHVMVMINRFSYWQLGYVILKGSERQVRAAGLEAFRASVAALHPGLSDRVGEIAGWEQVKLLTVRSNRLRRWYRPGLLCIGDAAHAMSPIGGVGINVAIQDAVVAANVLVGPLRSGRLQHRHLWEVQARRTIPVRVVQAFQNLLQSRVAGPLLRSSSPLAGDGPGGGESRSRLPRIAALLQRLPFLQWVPARLIGHGVWRVHPRRDLRRPSGGGGVTTITG